MTALTAVFQLLTSTSNSLKPEKESVKICVVFFDQRTHACMFKNDEKRLKIIEKVLFILHM